MDAATPPFGGFHREALAFFRGLAEDNSKSYWEANRATYETHVRAPLMALASALEGLFGDAHFYRPYRDLRFSKDKRPYKEQAAVSFGGRGPTASAGRYLQLDAGGLFVGAGAYRMARDQLAAYRRAVQEPRTARALAAVVQRLEEEGYTLHGETLRRAPRGVDADHPQLALLKRKGVFVARSFEPAPWLFTAAAADRVVRVFADAEPLVAWLRSHLE